MFLLEYIKNPRKVGAVAPSSKYLAYEMINTIDFENTNCIVEYGPGTGAFSEKILARAKESTTIILIQANREFYKGLKELYGYKENVIILNSSAEDSKKFIDESLKGKPEPDIYLMACSKFNRRPEDCIAVEDSINGVTAALRAGMKTIMVPDIVQPDKELAEKVYRKCDSLLDVKEFLESNK